MSWLGWEVLALVGWSAAALIGLVAAVCARRSAALALRIRTHVEPYLRRRATELDGEPPKPSDPTAGPEATVDVICGLADRLIEWERKQVELGDTLNVGGGSETMPRTPAP